MVAVVGGLLTVSCLVAEEVGTDFVCIILSFQTLTAGAGAGVGTGGGGGGVADTSVASAAVAGDSAASAISGCSSIIIRYA